MRRLEIFSLVLACLLTLAACGGGAQGQEPVQAPPPQDPPSRDGGGDVTVFDCGGLQAALPDEYLDVLYVDTDFPDAEESWKPLISVYEKASYDAVMEVGGGGGFLFGFLVMDQAAFEQHINADGSGIDVFAAGGGRYYAYTYPTDVQFYRRDAESLPDHPDWPLWEELCQIGPQVREDFLTRNGLQPFSVRDFLDQRTEGVDFVCVRYCPYDAGDGDTGACYRLLLRQPARQGEGGIWAVDQWLDEYGGQYLYFPDSGRPAAEYYAELQERCGAGELPELLTPLGAAKAFVKDYFGCDAPDGSFEEVPEADQGRGEGNPRPGETPSGAMPGEGAD